MSSPVSTAAHRVVSVSCIEEAISILGKKISLFAYFLFQVTANFFSLCFKQLYWNCKNYTHLTKAPAFLFSSPPPLKEDHGFGATFSELFQAYQELKGAAKNPLREINAQLAKGFCHAIAQTLVKLVQQSGTPLADQISRLHSHGSQLTLLETLEIFRYTFESHNRGDLITKMQQLLPEGMSKQANTFQGLENFKGVIVTRVYNDSSCHTLLLSLDPATSKYGFYNPAGGHYEYDSLDSLVQNLREHVACHYGGTEWELSFYPMVF